MTVLRREDPREKEKRWMASVQGYLCDFAKHPFAGTPAGAVLDDAAATTGKLLRPRLVLLAGWFGPDPEAVRERLCKLAAVVELLHTASLIHDDIVDDAPSRRGVPSLQHRYGKDAAVYAGDYLMSRVCQVVAREEMNESGAVLAKTAETMCAGEINQSLCRYRTDVTIPEYMRNIHRKTAALFMAACRVGASEGGCDQETVRRLEDFGEALGMLFQLRDDLLDLTSNAQGMGKEVQKDLRDGIYTMPLLWALEQPAGRETLLPILEQNAKRELSPEETRQVVQTVADLGGIEAARRAIRQYRQRAESALPPACGGDPVLHAAGAGVLRAMLEKLAAV